MKRIIVLFVLTITCLNTFCQETATKSDTPRKDALNVFMNASDYFRKEIPYVNYVRDIKDAGVYILSSVQGTGSGGQKFTCFLVGQQLTKSTQLFGNISANRITKEWKINSSINYNYGKDVFDTTGGSITSENISKSANILIVKSITEHWSYGGSASFGTSTLIYCGL